MERLITPDEAAAALGVSRRSLARFVSARLLQEYSVPSPTGGRHLRRYLQPEIERLITPAAHNGSPQKNSLPDANRRVGKIKDAEFHD